MHELEKALAIAAKGPDVGRALADFQRQIDFWGVAMPPSQLLVLDFGLGDFSRTGLIECWIANEVDAGYCGKYLFVFDQQTCPAHLHRRKHETFFIAKGRVRIVIDGAAREMGSGEVVAMPCGRLHSFTGIGPALVLELSTPCLIDDNYFENIAIPIGGNYQKCHTTPFER
jgi:mannose-6-phosphate isomerase-like protein (cupin superfamily)